jgi:Zn-finger nucleic acid-binding protein
MERVRVRGESASPEQGIWLDAGELERITQKEGFLGGFLKLFK